MQVIEKTKNNEVAGSVAARPGGRSARIQAAIFKAVEELRQAPDGPDMTVPAIAARAGVTPSTIYRRWGSLNELLAQVAAKNLRPDAPPEATGDWRKDLEIWLHQFVEEMSSEPGRAMLREVLGGEREENAGQCSAYTRQQLDAILDRAGDGSQAPTTDKLLDGVIAPVMYRILFTSAAPDHDYACALLQRTLEA
ncbi:Bacterial regulatory protein, tetR family [Nitratireductor basaltis]|uniref:Bacterial regulatory protein, tetR family n=1 Tax=Nitratireductor basaltis TaxID=472175 RepID=A0A084U8M8_9HYPH|nr:Bacterial regulatory protein, tetR family [Nitratireductor basaltis]